MRYVKPKEYRASPRQPLALLDGVAARFAAERFTFTEEQALVELWTAGEEVRLREDSRFWELEGLGHFQLSHHRLANNLLAEMLWHGVWDGTNPAGVLTRLDNADDQAFHVFCPADPRFGLEGDAFSLLACPAVSVPEELKRSLDAAADDLMGAHRQGGAPLTTHQLLELISRLLGDLAGADDADALEAWLCGRNDWAEVARGLWLPRDLVPPPEQPGPFRVIRVGGGAAEGSLPAEISYVEEGQAPDGDGPAEGLVVLAGPPVERGPDMAVSWTQVLRTAHLHACYLPVPVGARFRYPRFVGRAGGPLSIAAVAFESGREGRVWLDREHHRFYGEMVREIVEWEEAGRELRITWSPEAVVVRRGGLDERVREEESRHVDPSALHELRLGRGESYRQTLAAVLREAGGGMSFRELYDELSRRQGHWPGAPTLRAVLSQSPEFVSENGVWKWVPAAGAEGEFRRSLTITDLSASAGRPTRGLRDVAAAVSSRVRELMSI